MPQVKPEYLGRSIKISGGTLKSESVWHAVRKRQRKKKNEKSNPLHAVFIKEGDFWLQRRFRALFYFPERIGLNLFLYFSFRASELSASELRMCACQVSGCLCSYKGNLSCKHCGGHDFCKLS